MLVVTSLVNGGLTFGRLREVRLVALGLPARPPPVVWFAAISLVGAGFGAVVLRAVEDRISRAGVARRTYVAGCALGTLGLVLFAAAADAATAVAGVLLVAGVADPVVRAAGVVWLNGRTTSAVRATVHSLLSQAENLGEVVFGTALAAVAGASAAGAVLCAAALFASAAALVARATRD